MNLLDILLPRRKRERQELKKLEPEIKNLEEKLGLIRRTGTEVYYDPLYEVSIDRHEFDLSIKYEDMDKCAKELSEYFFKLENEENIKKELA